MPGTSTLAHAPMAVRKGDIYYDLSEAQYDVWMLGFQAMERQALLTSSVARGIEDVPRLVRDLSRAGLLMELHDRPERNRSLLEGHRLLPTAAGLGNSTAEPDAFVLSRFGDEEPRLTVDLRVYLVWGLSTQPLSVAAACLRVAAMFGVNEQPILDQLAVNLPLLVRHGVAFLDAA